MSRKIATIIVAFKLPFNGSLEQVNEYVTKNAIEKSCNDMFTGEAQICGEIKNCKTWTSMAIFSRDAGGLVATTTIQIPIPSVLAKSVSDQWIHRLQRDFTI